jgi:hypothetical protein
MGGNPHVSAEVFGKLAERRTHPEVVEQRRSKLASEPAQLLAHIRRQQSRFARCSTSPRGRAGYILHALQHTGDVD